MIVYYRESQAGVQLFPLKDFIETAVERNLPGASEDCILPPNLQWYAICDKSTSRKF